MINTTWVRLEDGIVNLQHARRIDLIFVEDEDTVEAFNIHWVDGAKGNETEHVDHARGTIVPDNCTNVGYTSMGFEEITEFLNRECGLNLEVKIPTGW